MTFHLLNRANARRTTPCIPAGEAIPEPFGSMNRFEGGRQNGTSRHRPFQLIVCQCNSCIANERLAVKKCPKKRHKIINRSGGLFDIHLHVINAFYHAIRLSKLPSQSRKDV